MQFASDEEEYAFLLEAKERLIRQKATAKVSETIGNIIEGKPTASPDEEEEDEEKKEEKKDEPTPHYTGRKGMKYKKRGPRAAKHATAMRSSLLKKMRRTMKNLSKIGTNIFVLYSNPNQTAETIHDYNIMPHRAKRTRGRTTASGRFSHMDVDMKFAITEFSKCFHKKFAKNDDFSILVHEPPPPPVMNEKENKKRKKRRSKGGRKKK